MFEDWENFLNNSVQSVHLVDEDGVIRWANDVELRALGYTRDEYVGRHIGDVHVDADVIAAILTLLTSGSSLVAYPARLRAKDGRIKHVMINSNVFRKAGEFVHTRCFTTEVSESVYSALRDECGPAASPLSVRPEAG